MLRLHSVFFLYGSCYMLLDHEQEFIDQAGVLVGVDEAGAGTLAGDLVVAACILDPNKPITGLNDSKKLSEAKREVLFEIIKENALAFHILHISPREIDRSNILACRMDGMQRCVAALKQATHAIVDGNRVPKGMTVPTIAVVKGDDKIDCVRASSILAKVARDRALVEAGAGYPDFSFSAHKGYGTAVHNDELNRFGPTPLHRFSYRPVKQAAERHNTHFPS